MKIALFSGSDPNGRHFCKLPHSQSHKLTRRGGGGGIDLVVVVPLPPQQIKTTEFQFSQGAHFQEDLKVIEI